MLEEILNLLPIITRLTKASIEKSEIFCTFIWKPSNQKIFSIGIVKRVYEANLLHILFD